MKRIILFLALVFALPVFADTAGGIPQSFPYDIPLLTYVSDNTTGQYSTTYVSTTTVDPNNCRIWGFEVFPLTTGGELVGSIYDATSTSSMTDTFLMGELEAVPENFAGVWFPNPRKLKYGLTIRQGAQTRVIVYYTRY